MRQHGGGAGPDGSDTAVEVAREALVVNLEDARLQGKASHKLFGGSSGRGMSGGLPPRQSSDSTLHPAPSGRPSSAPSGRSSFDSCADGATSDPSRSQRESLDEGGEGSGGGGTVGQPAAMRIPPQPSILGTPPRSPAQAGTQGAPPGAVGGSTTSTHLLGAAPQQQQQQPGGDSAGASAFGAHQPFSQHPPQHPHRAAHLGSLAGRSIHLPAERSRRRSTGKHPANLEHGSTAPPGAMDELAELLLAAASQVGTSGRANGDADVAGGSSTSGGSGGGNAATAAAGLAGGSGGRSSAGAGAGAGLPSAAARGAVPRRSAPAASSSAGAAGGTSEPLLSSQVAMLAQQLLQQQQHLHHAAAGGSGGGATAAAQLRRSLEQPCSQAPSRDRADAGADLRGGRTGGLTAAEMLLCGASGSGSLQRLPPTTAAPVLRSLDPASQPRFSSPTPIESSETTSPFSSIQGVYGCHLLPPADQDPDPLPSPSLTTRCDPHAAAQAAIRPPGTPLSRSSIDLLLDPAVPASARNHRHSLDTLQELLLSPSLSVGGAGSPITSVAQLLQHQQQASTSGSSGGAIRSSGGKRGSELRSVQLRPVRHSMDSGAAGARMESVARTLSTLPGQRRAGRIVDPAAPYYGHISSGAMHDIANSTVTVVAGAVPVPAGAASRTSVSAHASSMVDPAAQPAEGTFEAARVGTPEESMLDPDLHDTFGAHPSYGLPAARPTHRHSSSGGSSGRAPARGAAAMLSRANSGGGGSATSGGGAVADGWRQPMGAPWRPPLPRTGGTEQAAAAGSVADNAAGMAASNSSSGATAAAAAAQPQAQQAQQHHPTVYQPHHPPLPATSHAFSPIGHAMMLDPTTVPGQHSVTVHDPQYTIPSLHFLKQCALARKKLECLDSSSSLGGGGYIAEAKRVLAAAVHTATAQEAAVVESSCSGAIGPLLRYLRDNKHNDGALRSGLHTLSLLVTNSPNRGIIVSFQGQAMLCEAMRATQDVELRENIVQLLWDLEAAHNKDCHFQPEDILALQSVLEATSNALIASHILHLLCHCFSRPDAPDMSQEQMQLCAQRLVDEIAAHKHHLQDAAQYALGNLMAMVLGDTRVSPAQRQRHVSRLLEELRKTNTPGQCQVVLTVLSCIAGNARVRSAMAHCHARRRLMEFGQHIPDPRLRARSLSLIKILHKQETLESQGGGSWYFGAGGSEVSASPPTH